MTLRILIAPDKFKGSMTAHEAAGAMARGWRSVRPDDDVTLLPMADGGDGTAAVLGAVLPDPHWVNVPSVNAIGLPHQGRYLRSADLAVIELAEICGIAGIPQPEPMSAHTIGLGIVIAAAIRAGAGRLIIAPAGSASTDGGTGALAALGAQFVGYHGSLPVGGGGLTNLARVDRRRLQPVPDGGVDVLVDVDAVLFGPNGAAMVFGPQKGADEDQLRVLDQGLRRLAEVLGGDPDQPGAGAAGGTGYGLANWGARLVPGAAAVGDLIGLPRAVDEADVILTGEGRFDDTSMTGKVCGYVLGLAGASRTRLIAGSIVGGLAEVVQDAVSLSGLAGSTEAAMAEPERWLSTAGAQLATQIGSDG
ncbi:glycerate kinase [Jatrophihabitans sp. DSM 45814]